MCRVELVQIKKYCTHNGVRYFVFSILTMSGKEYLKVYCSKNGARRILIKPEDELKFDTDELQEKESV